MAKRKRAAAAAGSPAPKRTKVGLARTKEHVEDDSELEFGEGMASSLSPVDPCGGWSDRGWKRRVMAGAGITDT